MALSLKLCRSSLLISAALLTLVAFVVALSVLPAVKIDTFPLATPERAVPAFWVNIIFNLTAAIFLCRIAFQANESYRFSAVILGLLSLLIFIFAFALIDAARAYNSHGLSMHKTSSILFFCSITDLIAALLMAVTATFFPKRT